MFGEKTNKKNKRFSAKDFETELELCKIFRRPPRTFPTDPPFYPWLPPAPIIPCVNFSLNFTG